MKKKQMLAMLLAALMTLSVPLVAFAEGEPSDPNTADLVQPCAVDVTAPTISKISIDKTNLKAGETAKVTVEASDDESGVEIFSATFAPEGTEGKYITTHFSTWENPCVAELVLSPYLPSGTYVLDSIQIFDKAGNHRYYDAEPSEGHTEPLPNSLKITVINDDSVPTPPAPEQKPFQPSYSTGSSASGSSVTSVKSAPAASGSSIKQEEKDRQFWKNKQDQIRKAANGKKIKIFIPKETTRVPASFLESIRTAENDITVELRWNGKKITITPETALKRSPRRVFWNLKTLLEYYHA